MSSYPVSRPRRLRASENIRRLVRETQVTQDDLIQPLFVHAHETSPIPSMPGVFRFSVDNLLKEVEELIRLGVPGIILFGIPDTKDEIGSEAWNVDGIVPTALRRLKTTFSDQILLAADVCLCEYTSHGHCGALRDGCVDNDATLPLLTRISLAYAEAGADIIAPSDMMDGRIGAIRKALDTNGFSSRILMSYAIKHASAFYGPFREAADSAPQFGDRKSYQMDSSNSREAMKEAELDLQEGADILIVKPALPNLDLIYQARQSCHLPIAAYNVSGEYSMIKAAVANGWLDEEKTVTETLIAIKRAGADIILTYHAKDYLTWMNR